MKIQMVWVGKTKSPHLAALCDDYIKRIRHFIPLQISEVKEGKLLGALERSDRVIALDPNGKTWTSEAFASFIKQHMVSDPRRLSFVVGDYAGLPDVVRERADVLWSLSPLTFTHDLARLLLLEQVYRALSILNNLPYSK